MKITLISIMALFILTISCSDKKTEIVLKKDSLEKMTIKKDTAVTVRKEIATGNNNQFIIIETKPTISVSNYMITGTGFKNSGDTINYNQKNPMSTTLLGDLDKNGFDELYIITKAHGTQTFVDLIAIASNPDNSFNEIKIEQISAEDVQKDEMFSGYMGFDSIYISGNKIIREFPVYKSSDPGSEVTKERRKIVYVLKPNVEFYELVISDFENVNK